LILLRRLCRTGELCLEQTTPLEVTPWQEICNGVFLNRHHSFWKSFKAMTNSEQDRWSRVKGRLRSTVGEDVYTSWFARMDLEDVQDESVRLSVPTRFLKSWIQAHYAERVLSCWQAEMPEVHRIDLTVRTAMRSATPAKEPAPALRSTSRGRTARNGNHAGVRQS
jgi:DnaA N-terminal domain